METTFLDDYTLGKTTFSVMDTALCPERDPTQQLHGDLTLPAQAVPTNALQLHLTDPNTLPFASSSNSAYCPQCPFSS